MKLWVLHGSYEGESFTSIHLTEKGCALACIADVLEFLGVDNEEEALSVMNDVYSYTETDGEQTEAFEWDQEKMRKMSSKELWRFFLTGLKSVGIVCQIAPTTSTHSLWRFKDEHLGSKTDLLI